MAQETIQRQRLSATSHRAIAVLAAWFIRPRLYAPDVRYALAVAAVAGPTIRAVLHCARCRRVR